LTNHNKAAVYGLVSQPIMVYVDHITWQAAVGGYRIVAAIGCRVV